MICGFPEALGSDLGSMRSAEKGCWHWAGQFRHGLRSGVKEAVGVGIGRLRRRAYMLFSMMFNLLAGYAHLVFVILVKNTRLHVRSLAKYCHDRATGDKMRGHCKRISESLSSPQLAMAADLW